MINEQGGSCHDPDAELPEWMWQLPLRDSGRRCLNCARRSRGEVVQPLLEVVRPAGPGAVMRAAGVALALVCRRCDKAAP